jgi:hypothetical protein
MRDADRGNRDLQWSSLEQQHGNDGRASLPLVAAANLNLSVARTA